MPSIKDDRGYNQGFKHTRSYLTRTQRRCQVITDQFEKKEATALEIGCGTGLHAYCIAKQFPHVQVVGTDICESFIVAANKEYKLDNLCYELLDFNDQSAVAKLLNRYGEFDYVFGDGILHHLYPELSECVHSLRSLLKDGGKMLFWEPNIINPYCFLIFTFPFFRKRANLEPQEMAFSKAHVRTILQAESFSNISITHRDFLLPVTPDYLITTAQLLGGWAEKIPVLKLLSQSIFISAQKTSMV